METKHKDMTPHEAADALRWLAEMGADEIIGEEPVNRLAAPAPRPAAPAPAPAARTPARDTGAMPARPVAEVPAVPGASPAARCMSLAEIASALESFDACPLKKTATRLCFADGNPRGARDAGGRGAGPRRGHPGQALRRPLGPASRPDAGSHRPVTQRAGPGGLGLHHQRDLLAPARQPHAHRGRDARCACPSSCARSSCRSRT